jgi:hypothetical protein
MIWKISGFAAGIVMCFLIGLPTAAMLPSYFRSRIRNSIEKMLAEPSYQKQLGKYTLVFKDDGIASSSATGESLTLWYGVDRVSITPEYLFIFLTGPSGLIIPRAQVQDSTIEEVRAYVEAHIPSRPAGPV